MLRSLLDSWFGPKQKGSTSKEKTEVAEQGKDPSADTATAQAPSKPEVKADSRSPAEMLEPYNSPFPPFPLPLLTALIISDEGNASCSPQRPQCSDSC